MDGLHRELGLTDDEYEQIEGALKREPTRVELGMYSLMWSEHCSYKSSKSVLSQLPTHAPHVLQGPGENAGVVEIGGGMAVAFKMESHNHPSAVEPYEGAATGVGGIVRDIFTMGARPVACMGPLRFGDLSIPRNRYLLNGVISGIAGYGNCLGVPTVGGELKIDPSYNGNPLVNVMCVGLMRRSRLTKGIAAEVGEAVVLYGNRTGRDGIGGASVLASQEFDEMCSDKRPSVQVGDPFTEKLLIEVSLELIERGLVRGLQDLGAGGISCAASEMAAKGGVGITIHADRIPLRENMEPFEIMISESQERMLAVADSGNIAEIVSLCKKWGLDAVVVGEVTDGDLFRVLWQGEEKASVPAYSLTSGPKCERGQSVPSYLEETRAFKDDVIRHPQDMNDTLRKLIGSPNICSKQFIWEQYDHMVQLNTVELPGSDAAVLRVRDVPGRGIAITCDGNNRYVYLDPFLGTEISVMEAARNVVVSGAVPLAATNCLNFGNPEREEIFWQFHRSVEGLSSACRALEVPVVSGNVSFYNETSGNAIQPTPIIGMLGIIGNLKSKCSIGWKSEDDIIILLGETKEEIGGSEYLWHIHGICAGVPPSLDMKLEKNVQSVCMEAIRKGLVLSAHDCSDGGLAIALLECCMLGRRGAEVRLKSDCTPPALLFGESQSRIIISARKEHVSEIERLAESRNVPIEIIGKTGKDRLIIGDMIDVDVQDVERIYTTTLASILESGITG